MTDAAPDPPPNAMARYRSRKKLWAGQILRIDADGCHVQNADGSSSFHRWRADMKNRYNPQLGDYWAIYDDGFQMIWPAWAFEESSSGFERIDCPKNCL